MLTAIRPWQLRSSSAHGARTFAVEVQQCLAKRIGETLGEEDEQEEEEEEEEQTALIKSKNPHLAGGEKQTFPFKKQTFFKAGVFFLKPHLKSCKKRSTKSTPLQALLQKKGPQRVPPCRPLLVLLSKEV